VTPSLAVTDSGVRPQRLLLGAPARHRLKVAALQLTDLASLTLAFLVATWLVPYHLESISVEEFLSLRLKILNFALFLCLLLAWHVTFAAFGLYDPKRTALSGRRLLHLGGAVGLCALLVLLQAIPFDVDLVSAPFLSVLWLAGSAIVAGSRLLLGSGLDRLERHTASERRILIVGTGPAALRFAEDLERNQEPGCRILGFVDDEWAGIGGFHASGRRVICDLKNFASFVRDQVADEVVIALPLSVLQPRREAILGTCERLGVTVRFLACVFSDLEVGVLAGEGARGAVLMTVFNGKIEGWAQTVKRLMDVALAAVLLLAFAPIFAVAALAVRVSSPGSIFFGQERVGLNGRRFLMYKFRTMTPDAEERLAEIEHLNEAGGPVFKLKEDPRVTRVGRFLRSSSVDELPQLLNVLKGDMSLVGPRPLPLRDVRGFDEDRHRRRFSVRPGITGLWQVSGRSLIGFEEWMELDLRYIEEWSLTLDLEILARTPAAVLRREGAT
jgi:exopolysaccharide biosynthesis polyprenyl glycosylphosphotransferase